MAEKKGSLGLYETQLVEVRLEDEYNYKNYLPVTSENFKEIFQLIKDDTTKENTKLKNQFHPD